MNFQKITLFTLLFLTSFVSSNVVFAFSAEGYGESAEEAKKNAYSALSQKILAEISTELSQTVTDNNGEVSRSGEKKVALSSEIILKGVEYQNIDKSFFGNFSVTAVLTPAAFTQTLTFYDQSTEFDPMGVSQTYLKKLDRLTSMWQAVLQITPNYIDGLSLNKHNLLTKRKFIDGLMTASLIKVVPIPTTANLFINGENQPTNEPIIVSPGEHSIELVLKDFKPIKKNIFVNQGQSKQLVEELISLKVTQQRVKIVIDATLNGLIQSSNIETILTNFDWQADPESPYEYRVSGFYDKNQIGDFIRYQFDFDIGIYKNNRKLRKVRYKDRVTARQTSDIEQKIWKKLSKKMSKATHLLAASVNFE